MGGHPSGRNERQGSEVRGSLPAVATLTTAEGEVRHGSWILGTKMEFYHKPFPLPLRGEIPQDHFLSPCF